jgi:hypothetical protein
MNKFVIDAAAQFKNMVDWRIHDIRNTGMLPSEVLAVCGVIEELNVEVMIEVGKPANNNKRIFENILKDDNTTIICLDSKNNVNERSNQSTINKYINNQNKFRYIFRSIGDVVKNNKNKRVAILFKGPLKTDLFHIFSKIITNHENVKVGFFHGCWMPGPKTANPQKREINKYYDRLFFTDDIEYVRQFGSLDEVNKTSEICQSDDFFFPYTKNNQKIGSYGPTLAVVIPTERDKARWEKILSNCYYNNLKKNPLSKFKSFTKKILKVYSVLIASSPF